jgi:hypothetical protein
LLGGDLFARRTGVYVGVYVGVWHGQGLRKSESEL